MIFCLSVYLPHYLPFTLTLLLRVIHFSYSTLIPHLLGTDISTVFKFLVQELLILRYYNDMQINYIVCFPKFQLRRTDIL